MAKRIIILGAVIMCLGILGIFSGCGNDYVYKESDFKLTIQVDKTEAIVGDTVKVTVRLENLSGRDIPIQMSHPKSKVLEDMISIRLFQENEEHLFVETSVGGPLRKLTIKKDAVITRTAEFQIDDSVNYEAASLVVFYTGKNYKEIVPIYSETIKIVTNEVK